MKEGKKSSCFSFLKLSSSAVASRTETLNNFSRAASRVCVLSRQNSLVHWFIELPKFIDFQLFDIFWWQFFLWIKKRRKKFPVTEKNFAIVKIFLHLIRVKCDQIYIFFVKARKENTKADKFSFLSHQMRRGKKLFYY